MARGDYFRTNATKRLGEIGKSLEDSRAMEDWEILRSPALGVKTLKWLRDNYPRLGRRSSEGEARSYFPYEECF